jgi:hypothetical protein
MKQVQEMMESCLATSINDLDDLYTKKMKKWTKMFKDLADDVQANENETADIL